MTESSRPPVRQVGAAHQSQTPCHRTHAHDSPAGRVRTVEPGWPEGTRLAEQVRATLSRSPTLWVQTAHVAGPVGWHGLTPIGSVVLGIHAQHSLVADVRRHGLEVSGVVAAAELGPAGMPDRVLHRAWLAGWLREVDGFEFDEMARLATGTVRGPHVARRLPQLRVLVLDVAEVLVPEGAGSEAIYSVDLTDYALA